MSPAKDKKNNSPAPTFNEIVLRPLEQVIHDSMIPYSEFVIMDRALPRVEDGLKPVQRRVLYSMLEVGVTPDKPYRKSARIVGDCMGKYHPHGDKSIYDTMVRMAQSFNMREILVDGHGNYGSVDGDGAAAMRYTEARLSPISLELLRDIEKNTVSWSFNFDDTTKEPDMLPGRFPNLLVNGSTGIAVGLATNIPTHNLAETIDATVAVIENKKITLEEVMEKLPAPDFSTGGYILKSSELKQIYETGKGKLVLRAKVHFEEDNGGKTNIVITEIPYQVNKANMLQRIAKLKDDQSDPVYAFISDIVDESDRDGTRAVIKTKKDTNIGALLQTLYKDTDLQINFNVNMVAIAGGKPKQMSLLDILHYYIAYQKQVIFRRTQYDLDVSEKRAHILEGLLIAIQNIDEVIAIIKSSKSVNEAKETLMKRFSLSEVQAQAILDMRLSRLTNLEVTKLISELESLHVLIVKLKRILESDKMQYNLIKSELLEIKKSYPSPRLTQLLDDDLKNEQPAKESATALSSQTVSTPTEPVVVVYSAGNTIKAVPEKNYHLSQKEFAPGTTTHDVPQYSILTTTGDKVYLFTNTGVCHMVAVQDIPLLKFKERGVLLNTIITNYEGNETVVAMLDLDSLSAENQLVIVTQKGMVKCSPVSEYLLSKQTFAAIKLADGDQVVSVAVNQMERTLCLVTKQGIAIVFNKTQLTPIGRLSQGVKGISLADKDLVVGSCQFMGPSAISIFMQNGNAKVLKAADIPVITRGGRGSRIVSLSDKNNPVVKVFLLTKNISYVTKSSNSELTFVLNKKMSLEDKDGRGRNVLTTKSKSVTCTDVYEYVVLEDL